jgi:nucleoside-diphosphate kinase
MGSRIECGARRRLFVEDVGVNGSNGLGGRGSGAGFPLLNDTVCPSIFRPMKTMVLVEPVVETTLLIIKPDGVRRRLVGEVISRVENKGLRITALKMLHLDKPTAERLYSVHRGKSFFDILIEFMISGPIVAMKVEGPRAIELVRNLMGATKPEEALPGTIRGDYASDLTRNICHGADSRESAKRELAVLFPE